MILHFLILISIQLKISHQNQCKSNFECQDTLCCNNGKCVENDFCDKNNYIGYITVGIICFIFIVLSIVYTIAFLKQTNLRVETLKNKYFKGNS